MIKFVLILSLVAVSLEKCIESDDNDGSVTVHHRHHGGSSSSGDESFDMDHERSVHHHRHGSGWGRNGQSRGGTVTIIGDGTGTGTVGGGSGKFDVIIYQHIHYNGWNETIKGVTDGGCVSFPKSWLHNRVSAIKTNGHCVILYDKPNCKGDSRRIDPKKQKPCPHDDFTAKSCNFSDKPISVSGCKLGKKKLIESDDISSGGTLIIDRHHGGHSSHEESFDEDHSSSEHLHRRHDGSGSDDERIRGDINININGGTGDGTEIGGGVGSGKFDVVIYQHKHHSGVNETIKGVTDGGCVSFPKSWLHNRVSAIKTNGHCVILYDKPDCKGDSRKLEAKKEKPCPHDDFTVKTCNFSDKPISVSGCKLKKR